MPNIKCVINQPRRHLMSLASRLCYRDYLIDEKQMSPRSVRNRLAGISSLFKHLKNEQVIDRIPVENIQRPKVDEEQGVIPAMLTSQVVHMLSMPDIETVTGARDSAILHLLFLQDAGSLNPRESK